MSFHFKKFLRTERGERIDQPDFQAGVDDSQRAQMDEHIGQFLIGPGQPGLNIGYVVSGFLSSATGTVITTNNGVALVGYNDGGTPITAALLAGGDTQKSINIASFTDGTYGLFVRLSFKDSDFGNRVFWDALAVTPVETPKSIATRRSEDWDIAVETQAPGPEWMQIYSVAKADGVLTLTDVRQFFFEGLTTNNYSVVDAEWGATADRNTNRSTNGVFSIYKAIRGLQRQVQDIIGGSGWWMTLASQSALSLKNLNSLKLNRDGTNTITGNIVPDVDDTRNLGSDTFRFFSVRSDLLKCEVLQSTIGVVEFNTGGVQAIKFNFDDGSAANRHTISGTAALGIRLTAGQDDGVQGTKPIILSGSEIDIQAGGSQPQITLKNARASWSSTDVTGANPNSSTGFANTLTAKNTIKMWARIRTDGAGGASLIEGFNVGTPTITSSTTVDVPFVTNMADTHYVALITENTPTAVNVSWQITPATNKITIVGYDTTNTAVNLSVAPAHALGVLIIGVQNT